MFVILASLLATTPSQDADPMAGKKLVWHDEFQIEGLPDSSKWLFEHGKVRNHEAQYYTENRSKNARIEDRHLIIEARHETYETADVTSAALESKQSWTYGYFEVKAKYPTGKGTWPAIWFLGDAIRQKAPAYIGWPKCGEIDLMENVGFDPDKVHFNIHVEKNSTAPKSMASSHLEVPRGWDTYHVYGLNLTPMKADFYFDGKLVMSYLNDGKGDSSWPFEKPIFMILNLAIGGDWGGSQGVDPSIFPSRMEVAYARVYQ